MDLAAASTGGRRITQCHYAPLGASVSHGAASVDDLWQRVFLFNLSVSHRAIRAIEDVQL